MTYIELSIDVRSPVSQLIGKPAGVFFSTGTQNGGQETTALTFVTQVAEVEQKDLYNPITLTPDHR